MANLTATLYITVKTASGKWTTVKPAMSANGRLKALVAIVNGKEEKHPEGKYKVRWRELLSITLSSIPLFSAPC